MSWADLSLIAKPDVFILAKLEVVMTAVVVSPIKREILQILKSTPDPKVSDSNMAAKIINYRSVFETPIPEWLYLERTEHQALIIDACLKLKHPIWSTKPTSEMVYACAGVISLDDDF